MLDAARDAGLGVVIDIVPNHLGISVPAENPAWWDVLRHGRDVGVRGLVRHRLEPRPDRRADAGRRCDPDRHDGELRYFEHRFPLAPGTEPATTRTPCTRGSTTSWCTSPAATPS